jgi:pilus assembly protein FimV
VTEPLPRAPQPEAAESLPDFALDAPSPSAPSIRPQPAVPAADPHTIDFNLEPLPSVDSPMDLDKVSSEPPASVDFKLDLSDLDINAPARTSAGPARDDHWYDVQQKFDLAKAYEEMGDKDGARDILQEVVREGDTEQQAQAKKLLGSLG